MEVVQVLAGRYRLVERLGTGGMSVVWRAYDEVLGRQVAVKVLAAKLTADPDSRDRIRAEAQAAARLSHPHVTGVYDYGESTTDDGQTVPYVVMELISGRTLAERLARGPLPWRAALRVGAEVAAGLAAAHARGLVHRDVKPANVMLTGSGAKVVDFGIAAVAGENGDPGTDGIVLGTPAYLAPERLAGGPVRPATDVYALGLLLYRSLTGNLPWLAETTTQMITAHVYAEPSPLPAVDGLPDGVADLCLRCLAKDPADRPSSREVARTLAAAAGIRVPLPADKDEPEDLVLDPLPVGNHPGAGRPAGRLRQAVAALFGPGVDPFAETSILPSSIIDSAAIRNRHRRLRRRAIQISGATVGLVAVGLLVTTCSDLPGGQKDNRAAAATGPAAALSRAVCTVRYVTRHDVAGQFQVDLTVTNNTTAQIAAWALQFHFDGDQTLRTGTAGNWGQAPDGTVTGRDSAGDGALGGKASTTIGFQADYHSANPMPTSFTLNGAACTYVLVGASGQTQTGGPGITVVSGGEAAGGEQGGGPAGGNRGPVPVGGGTTGPGGGTTGGEPAPLPPPTTGNPDPVPTNKKGNPKPSRTRTRTRSPKPDPSTPPPVCDPSVCAQMPL